MHISVRDIFADFSEGFENRVQVFYLDTHRPPLVTIGIGNLVDPISEVLKLPMRDKGTGLLASQQRIAIEWARVKALTAHAYDATQFWVTTAKLYLADADIDELVNAKMEEFEGILKRRVAFVGWEDYPADAQLAILSMSWAMGPSFNYPHFEAACLARNFAAACEECYMPDENNHGLIPRNKANRQLLTNAAAVVAANADPGILHYPEVFTQ